MPYDHPSSSRDQTEEWRPVADHPDYEVSNAGRVRRAVDGPGNTWAGRVLVCAVASTGYRAVSLQDRRTGKQKQRLVHRLVALAFLGPAPQGTQVNHKDGVKTNNRPTNLEYVTPKQNTHHAMRAGLRGTYVGEQKAHKLTESDVREIVARVNAGETRTAVAADKGVCREAVRDIMRGLNWTHLGLVPSGARKPRRGGIS